MTPVFSVISSFFICSYSMSLLFIQSIIVSLCLPRVLVPSILPSNTVCRMDSLLNTWPNQFFCLCWMVFIKRLFSCAMVQNLDWIGVQSNWFSLPFSKSTFQTIAVVECPPSSTSMFLWHTVPCSKSESLRFFNSRFIFPVSNSPRLLNFSYSYSTFHFLMTFTVFCDYTS